MTRSEGTATPGAADRTGVANAIRVRGARTHNLKDVDVDVPRDRFVVITGPSGSGKSSLAFDTIYAEGQRQYIESLSVHARQFLDQMERPEVDLIDGLQPTICIDQRPGNRNPRSTVATVTEVYDYLRVLLARLGTPYCYRCGAPISRQTPEQIQDRIMRLPEGTKTMILAPMVRGRKGQHQEVFAAIRRAGFVRTRVDGTIHDVDNVPPLAPRKQHRVEAVIDRIIAREGLRARVGESVQLALRHGEGLAMICYLDTGPTDTGPTDTGPTDTGQTDTGQTDTGQTGTGQTDTGPTDTGQTGTGPTGRAHPSGTWRDEIFSTRHACPKCNVNFEELEPRTFSFNSPYGACPVCEGLGASEEFDPELVVPDHDRSLAKGAVAPWRSATGVVLKKHKAALADYLAANAFDWETPLASLAPAVFDGLLYGDDKKFLGVLMMLEKELATTTRNGRVETLATFRGNIPCQACHGSRLRQEAANVRLGGKRIHEITGMTVDQARTFFAELKFPATDRPVADPLVGEIDKRLEFLQNVGVEYLTLDRPARTLSGGEQQRVRLATSIGSGLVGVCYILDEPSIGLHQRDHRRLIDALRDLQSQGNTVVVVEHDEAIMRQADLLIDVGPGAGASGGRIVAQGTPEQIQRDGASITGRYLAGSLKIPVPKQRRRTAKSRSLVIEGVGTNNLKDVAARFPLAALVCVTGVSGSGKSSLVNGTLAPALLARFGEVARKPGPFTSLRGAAQIDKAIQIGQSPIGRTPRSNPATYTGVFDEIRKVFAGTREAKQRGFRASRFSFNVKGGRCDACQGQGVRKIEMNFLPDLYVTCRQCGGARFNRQTLQVRFKGRSIAEVLDMPVDEAAEFFENFSVISRLLASLRDVGLGYLPLGQPSTTLSGGEAQRIKLATQLARVDTGSTLYLLDEPTTGLHFDDIRRLLDVLNTLVDKGNTVIVIEHNLDVVKCADWVIDLGPGGGEAGGRIVATGTPEQIAARPGNHTGRFLRPMLTGS